MEELGRRSAARTRRAIVVTPHNVHVEGHFAVGTAGRVGEYETDRGPPRARRGARRRAAGRRCLLRRQRPRRGGVPARLGRRGPAALLARAAVVVVAPARDRPLAEHVQLGEAIAAATGDRAVALVASADHGHAHDPDGPYGFDPGRGGLRRALPRAPRARPLDFEPLAALVEPAKADSLWQLLVLQGAVSATGPSCWRTRRRRTTGWRWRSWTPADHGQADLLGDHVARRLRRRRGRQLRLGRAGRGGARVRQRPRAAGRHLPLRAPDVRGDGLLGDRAHARRPAARHAGLRGDLAGGRQGRLLQDAGDGIQRAGRGSSETSTPRRSGR